MCQGALWLSVRVLTTVEPNKYHDKYVIILFPTRDIENKLIRSQWVLHTGF